MAADSAARADANAVEAAEIAKMAAQAAESAERAAETARHAAERAAKFAADQRSVDLADAEQAQIETKREEAAARERYHAAEAQARALHRP
jgi:hypothetical protein